MISSSIYTVHKFINLINCLTQFLIIFFFSSCVVLLSFYKKIILITKCIKLQLKMFMFSLSNQRKNNLIFFFFFNRNFRISYSNSISFSNLSKVFLMSNLGKKQFYSQPCFVLNVNKPNFERISSKLFKSHAL